MKDLLEGTILSIKDDFPNKLSLKELIYRFVNFIIFGWILSLYIYIPFLVYMNYHGFFSYDLFNSGLFAINIISLYAVYFLIGFSVLFSFSFGLAFSYKLAKLSIPNLIYLGMIFHILIIIFAIYMIEIKSNEDYTLWIIFLIFVSFPISLHLSFIFTTLFTSSKHLLINTILSFCILLPISFFGIFESSSSKLTSIVFKIFYIGGEIPIKIKDENNPNLEYQGKLIFLSPDNIFLRYYVALAQEKNSKIY